MTGTERHVAGLLGQKEGLGDNWKSAQCVTSLYDSYIQLQQENEQLRQDAQRFQHESDLHNKQQNPEDSRCVELEQEIRLLRSEKLRLEEAHRLELQKLETRAAASETQHQQLVVKYQERFEFDPLEAKRAAMAVKTMQNTLQNVVLEKEEIGIRYGVLKEQYRKFHNEQVQTVETLKQRVKTFELQRVRVGQQRVVNALATWSTDKVQNVWNKWMALVKEQRLQEENKKMMNTFERKVDDRVAKIRGNQAAVLAMKLLQQAARRNFLRWRDLSRRNVERRRKGIYFAEERSRRKIQRVMVSWRVETQKLKDHRAAAFKIERLVACHSRRWGMRKWSVQTFRLALAEKDRRLDALSGTMELQAKMIVDLEKALDESKKTWREMQMRHEEEKVKYSENVDRHRAAELAVRQKLGRFFTKQSDRQLLKEVLREWRITAKYLRGLNQRTDVAQEKLRIRKLRRFVDKWHCTAHENHKKRLQTQQILVRMRQLSVLKCFNSWKERVQVTKAKKMALLHAVNRIRYRGVARCFTQWAAFREQRMELRQGIELMNKYAIKQQVSFTFSLWEEIVSAMKIQAQVRQQQLMQQAWENRLEQAKRDLNFQRECFTRWYDVVLERQRRDVVVRRCLARLKNGSLARILGSWREFVECRKTQRELVRQWVYRCHNGVLQRAWNQWQRQIVLKEQQLLMLRLHQERDAELKQLEIEFDQYRKTQQTLLEEAQQVQTEQYQKLKEAAGRLQEEAKRARRFAGAVETLCSSRDRGSTQLRCFKAWQKVVRRAFHNRQTVDVFQTTIDVRQTRAIMSKWRQFTTQQKRLRAVFTKVRSCFSRWWQIECFKVWKEARRRSKAVQVFSMLFVRNSEMNIFREMFMEWRKLARKNHILRKTLETIWLGFVHAKMRQQFTHWVEFTKTEAAKERLEKRNVALTAIRAKVWWKQSVSIMRFCFAEWKQTVESKKKRRLAERKLMMFQQTRLMTVYFIAWTDFVTVKGQVEHRNGGVARWLRKIQRRKQQQAMNQWKMLLIRNQQRDLQELKELKNTQQEKIQLQMGEIALLMQTTAETKRKLEDVTDVHDESSTKVQYLTECRLVAKYFNALKLKVSMRRHQRQAVHFCQKNARRRHLAELFSKWYLFSQNCRAIKLAVIQKVRRCDVSLIRVVLRQWQHVACHQRVIKQKQRKLQHRIRARIIKRNFTEWRGSIHREKSFSTAMDQLEIIVQKLQLKNTLLFWQQKCLQEKNRALQEKEKHKKIMQFLMGRQEAGLVLTFHSWKAFTQTKRSTRAQAYQQYTKKCQAILSKCWYDWSSTVQTVKIQRKSALCLQVMIKRYYYRVALSRWRRYRFIIEIKSLQTGNEDLFNQIAESNRRLESKSMSIDRLSTELMELQDKLYEAESKSSTVNLRVTSQETKRSKQLSCLRALSKIMLKRTVSREMSEAFTLWKSKFYSMQRKHRVLKSVANIRQRRKKLFAFWLWKVKTLRWRQLESLKKLWGRSDRLTIFLRWRKYSTTQAKLRLFLTKRCLLSCTNHRLPVSIAFRFWKTKSAELTATQQVETLHTKLRIEQNSASTNLRRLALGKWCWVAYHHRLRQMRSFLSRCYANSTKNSTIQHRRAIEEMQLNSEAALAKVKEQSEARVHEGMGALTAAEEQLTAGASFQALQTLIRRLFQSTTVKDLFVSVASTFAQILHGSAAVLFLFDPSSNELWTQREENQLIQVPASLGVAGSTLSSGSTLIIMDIASDPRFHPMVDQFAMNGFQHDDISSTVMMATSRPNLQTSKSMGGMVSSALVSTDGAVYGVLQVAFPTSRLSPIDRRVLVAQAQLYSKNCCFYVEQIVFEMLRNCRDRVRARIPEKFIKLFKQNKNWQKYYSLIERKAAEMEYKLRDVLDEREQLIQSKNELQKRHRQVKDKLESSDRNTKDVNNLMIDWKKKLSKWQKVLDEKDRAIGEKINELERVKREFDHYRRERRSKDLQSVLNSASPDHQEGDEFMAKPQSLSDRGQLSILRADQTRLKSQLVRAEADNLLLVKAISIARIQHGELPRTIQTEVTRVATRVSRRAPPEA